MISWLEFLNNLSIGTCESPYRGQGMGAQQAHFKKDETRHTMIEREVAPFVLPALNDTNSMNQQKE